MFAVLHALGRFAADLFKSRCRLEAENLLLRHQLTIALRQAPSRLRLRAGDRALLIWMTLFKRASYGLCEHFQDHADEDDYAAHCHRKTEKAFGPSVVVAERSGIDKVAHRPPPAVLKTVYLTKRA
jgi:hypothetical protein